jgi:NADH-quinone oxidoreductase subunit A
LGIYLRDERALHPPLTGAETAMEELLSEYFPILVFLGIAMGIAILMVGGSMIVAKQRPDSEKLSAYECGFEAFDDARSRFDVRFYLVTLLFIIFDLEVAFLFPWAVALGDIGLFGFWSMVVFLGVLTIGFIYEWRKGALEWE